MGIWPRQLRAPEQCCPCRFPSTGHCSEPEITAGRRCRSSLGAPCHPPSTKTSSEETKCCFFCLLASPSLFLSGLRHPLRSSGCSFLHTKALLWILQQLLCSPAQFPPGLADPASKQKPLAEQAHPAQGSSSSWSFVSWIPSLVLL